MNKKYLILIMLFVFINYNFAYNLNYQETKLETENTWTYYVFEKINVTLESKDLINNDLKIEIPIVPCYDLYVKIKDKKYTNIKYTDELLTIYLNEPDIIRKQNIDIEIIYLTDYYTNKNNNFWNLKYHTKNFDTIKTVKIIFPKYSKIKDTTNFYTIESNNSKISATINNINEINVDYEINVKKNKTTLTIIILSSIAIIFTGVFLFFKKKKNIQKDNPLLLGLNENEQKIMKLIIEKEGQSQKQITIKSYLPKGTVSRNIKKLENKEYIEIKKYGISNKLFLGKNFKKK